MSWRGEEVFIGRGEIGVEADVILSQTKLNGQPRDCWGPLVSTARAFRFTVLRHRFKSRGLDHHSSTENVESSELRW